jgi:dephospho-CoA kinase
MKVFITASSGVGKTAVIGELKSRSYTAYDADDRDLHLTRLEVKETGEPVEWPKGFVDWHYYSWNADEERLKELLANDETVFLCGFLGNQEKLYRYFDKLIALAIDPTEHRRRLYSRHKREFGDDEQNNQRRLDKYTEHMAKFEASGFIIIDNSGPITKTADKIEQLVQEPSEQ